MNETIRRFHERNLEGHRNALARAEAKRDSKAIAEQGRLIREISDLLGVCSNCGSGSHTFCNR